MRRLGSGSPDLTAKRDLGRYYALLRDTIQTVSLTRPEIDLICEAVRGHGVVEGSYDLIWAVIDDSIRLRHLDKQFHVDGAALVKKVRELFPGQKLALVDAVETANRSPGDAEILRQTGLLRE